MWCCVPSRRNRDSMPSRYRRWCFSWRPWRSSQCYTLSSAWSSDDPGSFTQLKGRPSEAAVQREAITAPLRARAGLHRTTSSACLVSSLTLVTCVVSFGYEIFMRSPRNRSLIQTQPNLTDRNKAIQCRWHLTCRVGPSVTSTTFLSTQNWQTTFTEGW